MIGNFKTFLVMLIASLTIRLTKIEEKSEISMGRDKNLKLKKQESVRIQNNNI